MFSTIQVEYFRGEPSFVRDKVNSFLKDYEAKDIIKVDFLQDSDSDGKNDSIIAFVQYIDWHE